MLNDRQLPYPCVWHFPHDSPSSFISFYVFFAIPGQMINRFFFLSLQVSPTVTRSSLKAICWIGCYGYGASMYLHTCLHAPSLPVRTRIWRNASVHMNVRTLTHTPLKALTITLTHTFSHVHARTLIWIHAQENAMLLYYTTVINAVISVSYSVIAVILMVYTKGPWLEYLWWVSAVMERLWWLWNVAEC